MTHKIIKLLIPLCILAWATQTYADETKPAAKTVTADVATKTAADTAKPAAGEVKIEVKTEPPKEESKDEAKEEEKEPKPEVPPAPTTAAEAFSVVGTIIKAARGGHWALLVGLIVMLLTWLVNFVLKKKIPPKVLPWVAIGLGVIGHVAFAVSAGSPWLDAIIGGISTGLIASGSYSALGSHIPGIGKKKEA